MPAFSTNLFGNFYLGTCFVFVYYILNIISVICYLPTYIFSVFSSGMDRLYGNPNELSTKASIVDPVDFINDQVHDKQIFIGRNNTEIWAHAGSNVVFDCLVGRPNLEDHGPVSLFLKILKILSTS